MEKRRVLLGMSGGVDSTAAALLLREAGYEVVGATLQMHSWEAERCASAWDVEEAAAAAEGLGIPFCAPDCRSDFARWVMADFAGEYAAGRTPNPCVRCNRFVKFPALLRQADAMGCSFIATGHYARTAYDEETGRWQLLRGTDRRKDQSYVLYPLGQELLSRLLLPLGDRSKEEIRALAELAGLPNARKKDSQDICFIPDGDYLRFLRSWGGQDTPGGDFVDETGKVLGRHRGQAAYTLGQRRGLGVSADRPLYVVGKDPAANRVTLGDEKDLFFRSLRAGQCSWVSIPCPTEVIPVTAKTRYSQREAEAEVRALPDGEMEVTFREPQRAVTPGQSVVLYRGDLVLGGGIIEKAWNDPL